MFTVVDKSNEVYPSLKDAKVLQYQSDDLPEGLEITYTNVAYISCGKDDSGAFQVTDHGYWGWYYKGNYCGKFESPDEAIEHYTKMLETYLGRYVTATSGDDGLFTHREIREVLAKYLKLIKNKEEPFFESAFYWRDEVKKAVGYLRQGKARFASGTTNSDVDVFLEKHKSL